MSGAAPTREVAYRVFADEFADATYRYAESDEDRAPQYLVTPTGARINRVFVVGVLTETEEVSDGVLRARIVDPTGAFVLYAGQYQPDALAFFERADPPSFVALTGKARTFEPEGSDRILTSLRPERVNEVNSETRDSWVVQTALHTLERTGVLDMALNLDARGDELRSRLAAAGAGPGLAAGIPHAIREYEPTTGYVAAMQEMALDAVRVMAGEKDEVAGVSMDPNEGGTGTVLTGFADISLDATAAEPPAPDDESGEPTEEPSSTEEPSPTEPAVIEPGEEPSSPAEESTENAEADAESSAESVTGESTATEEASPPTDTGASETEAQPVEEASGEPEPERTAKAGAEIESGEAEESPAEIEPEEGEESPAESEPDGAEETPAATEPEESEELYELSEEERAEVEEKFDVGFESGTEIGSPEETEDIEPEAGGPPEPESMPEETESPAEEANIDDTEAESVGKDTAVEDEAPAKSEPAAEDSASETAETAAAEAEEFTEGELQNLVVETLQELGDGAGVPRSELIGTLQDRHGLEEADIEEAIQAALLGGRCFESGAEDLKPI